ncbi:MAG: hypothetical protein EBX09_06335 [Actinobacteria bacterium]|jgi:hypothetical protein|nr:hypothetical protein [Actinomycetota bacterium]
MTTDAGTTNELKMRLIDHIAALLDDLEMNDDTEGEYSDQAIVEMHERNTGLAGFLVASLGLSDASKQPDGYSVRVNLADPHSYVDQYLEQA